MTYGVVKDSFYHKKDDALTGSAENTTLPSTTSVAPCMAQTQHLRGTINVLILIPAGT